MQGDLSPVAKKYSQARGQTVKASVITIILLSMALSLTSADTPAGVKIDRGTLGPCKIMVAVPEKWNKKVLIIAHAMRTEKAPLTAEFAVADCPYKQLLDEGWLIAATSYRHSGYIVEEAIEDLDQLRTHVIATYGEPDRIFLEGWSMGGRIVTHIAEGRGNNYDGALAIGAVLATSSAHYTFRPRIPLLFISNQNEVADPTYYVAKAAIAATRPAFWHVARDGHCVITGEEHLAALRAVFACRETGKIIEEQDGTLPPPPSKKPPKGG